MQGRRSKPTKKHTQIYNTDVQEPVPSPLCEIPLRTCTSKLSLCRNPGEPLQTKHSTAMIEADCSTRCISLCSCSCTSSMLPAARYPSCCLICSCEDTSGAGCFCSCGHSCSCTPLESARVRFWTRTSLCSAACEVDRVHNFCYCKASDLMSLDFEYHDVSFYY